MSQFLWNLFSSAPSKAEGVTVINTHTKGRVCPAPFSVTNDDLQAATRSLRKVSPAQIFVPPPSVSLHGITDKELMWAKSHLRRIPEEKPHEQIRTDTEEKKRVRVRVRRRKRNQSPPPPLPSLPPLPPLDQVYLRLPTPPPLYVPTSDDEEVEALFPCVPKFLPILEERERFVIPNVSFDGDMWNW